MRCPSPPPARSSPTPTGSTAPRGGGRRSWGGRRCSRPRRSVAAASRPTPIADLAVVAEEMGRQVASGPLLPVNVVVDALARGGQPELVDEVLPGLMAGDTVAAWALAESRDVWGVDGLGETVVRRRRRRPRGVGSQALRRSRRECRRDPRERDVGRRADAGARRRRCAPGSRCVPGQQRRPRAPLRRPPPRRSSGPVARRRRARWAVPRPTSSTSASSRSRCRLAETVGRARPRVHDDARVPRRPLVVRSPARVVPGAEASSRRHAARARDREGMCRGGRRRGRHVERACGDATSASRRRTWRRASIEILGECVQLHGGIAMTWEHDLHLYERRAAVNRAVYGSPEYHEERLCALVETGAV